METEEQKVETKKVEPKKLDLEVLVQNLLENVSALNQMVDAEVLTAHS